MQRFKTYTSVFLLSVFLWIQFPPSLLHAAFANHRDTDDTECHLFHHSLGTHIEQEHVHCDIFKTNSPLYDSPRLTQAVKIIMVLLAEYQPATTGTYRHTYRVTLPPRGPPTA